jgi:hypothetical protein
MVPAEGAEGADFNRQPTNFSAIVGMNFSPKWVETKKPSFDEAFIVDPSADGLNPDSF